MFIRDRELTALNYYTNEEITIPLDPTMTPAENAQKYFHKYNKQKRTFEALSELIQETSDDIHYLESISNACLLYTSLPLPLPAISSPSVVLLLYF